MTDQPSPTPTLGDEPEGKKSKRPRSEVRKEFLDELTLAAEIVTAAEKPAYASALLEGGIDAAAVSALKTLVADARTLADAAGGKTTAKKTATLDEAKLKKALVLQIGRVQSLAIGKYKRGDPKRDDYYIGKKIDNSRAQLEQAALNVLTRATADTKLKVPAALLAKLAAANTAYVDAQGEQTDKSTDATTTRGSLAAIIKEVEAARRGIQSVADATWPALEKSPRPDPQGVQDPPRPPPGLGRHDANGRVASGRSRGTFLRFVLRSVRTEICSRSRPATPPTICIMPAELVAPDPVGPKKAQKAQDRAEDRKRKIGDRRIV